jgi:hypothetical protein
MSSSTNDDGPSPENGQAPEPHVPLSRYPAPPPLPTGKSMASMVLGILGLVLYFVVFFGVLLAIPALVLGLMALRDCKRGVAGGRDMAIVGMATSQITIALAILTVLAVATGGYS